MKKLEVVSGGRYSGKWEISDSCLRRGKYFVEKIPINDISSLETKEKVGRTVYADISLGTGEMFVVRMGVGSYKKLYSGFLESGNHPTSESLPIKKISILEVSISIIICLFFVVLFLARG